MQAVITQLCRVRSNRLPPEPNPPIGKTCACRRIRISAGGLTQPQSAEAWDLAHLPEDINKLRAHPTRFTQQPPITIPLHLIRG
jgi:hypothetical protein